MTMGPMRFDDRFLEEIKARLRLSDVIGRTVKLKRQGREYVGLSPFSKERTPSFFVNDDKGFFHDFSSGKHGDLISFLQETERLSFVEAVERLAAEAGVPMPEPDPQAAQQEQKRQGLAEWLEHAARWFESELARPVAREARDYLTRRGFPDREWGRFRIGFAPNSRTGLKDYLIAKGALPGELVEAGLLIEPEEGGAPYDRFRDRIIFPIADQRGRIVSFGGRAMDPQARAKYLNGPETSLFHKGRLLYGLPEARKLLHADSAGDGDLVVVEGYMDAIACQRAGIAAVAPLGTALTEDQMEVLWRLHPEPTLCFDGDAAGRRAASRSMDRALPLLKPGKSFKFALVTGGKDPDDVLREQGPAVLKAQLAATTPFVEALWVRERDQEPLDTPERKAGLKARLRAAAGAIADKDLAQAYRDDLLGRLDALMPARSAAPAGAYGRPRTPGRGGWRNAPEPLTFPTAEGRNAARRLATSVDPIAAALAKGALEDPHRLDDHLETLEHHGFGDPALSELAKEIIHLRIDADILDSGALTRHLRERGFDALLTDIDRAAANAGAPFLKQDVTLAVARSQWTRAFEVMNRLAALETAVASAKGNLAERSDMIAIERLKAERDTLKRRVRSGTLWDENEVS
ncbi:DNA primase [Caulobacter ginsengisoli]|uniref:DNA primase n=2 Tax=Caulobacter ginsengisoli TaxID=400775 RepID=A0ABU0IVU1_9CAUL|nr:DNA primase [Caulobacter ginsengisoli]